VILAFALVGGRDAAEATVQRCRLLTHAVSLGGVDTLIQHPAGLTHRPVEAGARRYSFRRQAVSSQKTSEFLVRQAARAAASAAIRVAP